MKEVGKEYGREERKRSTCAKGIKVCKDDGKV
jgi:hypothetical protein